MTNSSLQPTQDPIILANCSCYLPLVAYYLGLSASLAPTKIPFVKNGFIAISKVFLFFLPVIRELPFAA